MTRVENIYQTIIAERDSACADLWPEYRKFCTELAEEFRLKWIEV